jgi:copper resistance protein D
LLESALIVARLLQYLGAAVLFGSSLFFVYALPASGPGSAQALRLAWLPAAGAGVLGVSALLGLAAQASVLAGSLAEGVTAEAMGAVVAYMDLGKAAVVRMVAAFAALACLVLLAPRRSTWIIAGCLGAIATASLAWMGHAAATEGPLAGVHLASDIVHVLAAGLWIGALAAFLPLLLAGRQNSAERHALHRALRKFSGVGTGAVALLVLTGVINGWILVGPEQAMELGETPYGRLLAAKLVLFLAMLGLAAANRFRLTPMLGGALEPEATAKLKRNVALETIAAFAILALVAWLGTLAPPAA